MKNTNSPYPYLFREDQQLHLNGWGALHSLPKADINLLTAKISLVYTDPYTQGWY